MFWSLAKDAVSFLIICFVWTQVEFRLNARSELFIPWLKRYAFHFLKTVFQVLQFYYFRKILISRSWNVNFSVCFVKIIMSSNFVVRMNSKLDSVLKNQVLTHKEVQDAILESNSSKGSIYQNVYWIFENVEIRSKYLRKI
jgi:hypothetical protein